jgi:transcriptional regulator with XRE-family HTH domain
MARCFSGRRLRDERVSAGLSPEHIAIAVQRSAYSVREYEWGRVTPSVTTLARIADLLDCPIDRFFEEVADVAA